ncbi:MAG: TatD family hydrolase [Candidatus Micrarchaeota archaeon]|nr:TatD family hydrolase [Candidatus Micrarchaeota archaeon]
MIDVHCHLEQPEFSEDRDEVIKRCRNELKAVVTCCAHPSDFEITIEMVRKYKGFVFASVGIHPEYVKDISGKEKDEFVERIKKNRKYIVAIGEVGLDFYWVKEAVWREKQKELFVEMIELSKELGKPLVVHARDAFDECLRILEKHGVENVLMHLFGARHLVKRIVENGYMISVGPIVLRSKNHKKIVRDVPLELITLETDSPWFGFGKRNEPVSIKNVAERVAEIKKLDFDAVWNQCGKNAAGFFGLKF